jgi:hypothetical protein
MTDYYPLISKAVAGLNPDTPSESRRTLYERARAAQLAQLRAINPPLTEAEIIHERLAFEEAVHRVDEEAAQRAHDARVPTLNDLVTAADEIGNSEMSIGMPSMIVTGGGTGRLIRCWRWRSPPLDRQSAASQPSH